MLNENLLSADGFAFECPLADSLDSSVQSSLGIRGGVSQVGNEIYYNSENFHGASGITPEQAALIQQGLATTTAVVSGVSQSRALQGSCKKPLVRENFTNRGKWSTYKDCLAREAKAKETELAIEQAKAAAAAAAQNRGGGNDTTLDEGMSTTTKALLIGGGVVVLGIIGFFIYKAVKK